MTIFYFSGTGNTKWAVKELDIRIKSMGHHSSLYPIEEQPGDIGEIIRAADIIGIAFPVYAMNIPLVMQRFLQRLGTAMGDVHKKPLVVLTTAGYADGCGPYEVVRQLPQGSVALRGYACIKVAVNVIAPDSKTIPLSPADMKARLEKGRTKIDILAEALVSGRKKVGFGAYPFMGFIRKKMRESTLNFNKRLGVDSDRCTQCMTCAESCPTGSIKMTNGALEFADTCTGCVRCYQVCPTASILLDGKYSEPGSPLRYRGPEVLIGGPSSSQENRPAF